MASALSVMVTAAMIASHRWPASVIVTSEVTTAKISGGTSCEKVCTIR